jgi:hypothetical protein
MQRYEKMIPIEKDKYFWQGIAHERGALQKRNAGYNSI